MLQQRESLCILVDRIPWLRSAQHTLKPHATLVPDLNCCSIGSAEAPERRAKSKVVSSAHAQCSMWKVVLGLRDQVKRRLARSVLYH